MKTKIKVQDALIPTNNTEEDSRIFCDEIEYIADKTKIEFDHHLMFRQGKKLVFKIWLPNCQEDKPFKDINAALKSVGIKPYSNVA